MVAPDALAVRLANRLDIEIFVCIVAQCIAPLQDVETLNLPQEVEELVKHCPSISIN
jgi:hypothetical protein